MINTPEQNAYLALLRLPHNGPRSTQAVQAAMATLRDHIAEASGKDPELVQSLAEQVTAYEASRAAPDASLGDWRTEVTHPNNRQLFKAMVSAAGIELGVDDIASGLKKVAALKSRAALSAMPRDEAALADLALDYLHLAQPEFCSARCPSVGREGEPIPHLPECVSMRSLLDGLPFATPGATISTGLMSKLKKLAKYLTEKGEYEACDLIDTVVDRLSASPPTPARDEGLEALRKEETAHLQTIDERDIAQATADRLADLIAKMTGVEIGEHSAGLGCAWNDPHLNAIDAAEAFLRAPPARDEGLEALLAKALRRLAFWAQTSGGTAGRDDGLVAAIDVGLAALRQYDTKLAQEPRP